MWRHVDKARVQQANGLHPKASVNVILKKVSLRRSVEFLWTSDGITMASLKIARISMLAVVSLF